MLAAHKHPTPTIQMCLDGRSVVLVTFMFLGTAALGILLSIDRSMDIGYIFVFLLKYLISLKKVKFHKKRKICKLFVRRVHLFFVQYFSIFTDVQWTNLSHGLRQKKTEFVATIAQLVRLWRILQIYSDISYVIFAKYSNILYSILNIQYWISRSW